MQFTMPNTSSPERSTHINILLDRSGSMQSIADDVIGGFNRFLAEQQAEGQDARITLVQFDSQDPHEVVLGGVPVAQARPLDRTIFQPRGSTPLLDATAMLIQRARDNAALRAQNGLPTEHVVMVSITDGEENQSRRHDLRQVSELIKTCEAEGWEFVYLSAALDAYADPRRMGMDAGSIQAFSASGEGSGLMFSSLSAGVSESRQRYRAGKGKREQFFGADKPAEDQRKKEEGEE